MEGPLQPAYIDAKLQSRRGAYAHQRVVVLHLLLRALAIGRRQIAVVDQEALRLMVDLAVLPQALAHRFALLPGICEDQAFFAPRVFENIAEPRVRRLGS